MNNIESQILAKQKLLKDNYNKLKKDVNDNEHLVEVLEKYQKYMEENVQLINAFKTLQTHLNNLDIISLTKNQKKNLKKEHNDIIYELQFLI
jgi:hypothetical protein